MELATGWREKIAIDERKNKSGAEAPLLQSP
jgi:hypothetical protein